MPNNWTPKLVGEPIVCPHQDGNFLLTVEDLAGTWTGACMIKQKGQGDEDSIVVTKDEALLLIDRLNAFINS